MSETAQRRKLIVIDGNSLANRAFYALPLLTTQKGVPTNAIYGFLTMLNRVMQEEKPDYLAVAFDKGRKTFRTERFEGYKAQRKATPDELRPQFPILKEILGAFHIPIFELDGYEADDLIGGLVRRAEEKGFESLIVTGDRDAWQLITPRTKVWLTRKGISEVEVYDETLLKEKLNLTPDQVRDLKGLMGDPSDNIPGVPGVGEKTALKLLEEFRTVENLLENLDQVKGKLKDKLAENRELAVLSKELATIVTDTPAEVDWETLRVSPPDYRALARHYRELEFKTLLKALPKAEDVEPLENGEPPGEAAPSPVSAFTVVDLGDARALSALAEGARQAGRLAVAYSYQGGSPRVAELQALALAFGPDEVYLWTSQGSPLPEGLRELLADGQVAKWGHDLKALILLLAGQGCRLGHPAHDTMLSAYLIDSNRSHETLAQVVDVFLERPLDPGAEGGQLSLFGGEDPWRTLTLEAAVFQELVPRLEERLKADDLWELFTQVEMPLVEVLAAMEKEGVALDLSTLEAMSGELEASIQRLTTEIYEMAGETFNINSTQQLGVILFDRLGLPVVKKTKTGYSTDAEVLDELSDKHPIVPKILEYRQIVKLKSTYVEGLRNLVDKKTGRVHTTFNQAITATGRLSSTEPNLQNIPIRLEEGRKIRKAFVAGGENKLILAADYSQIELRILAHVSKDPYLTESFVKEQDVHTRTASEVFGVPMEKVGKELRRRAKAVNFGIVYGISDFGLSRDLGVPRSEAKQYIESYFAKYHGVKEFIDAIIAEARRQGYVTTLLKRRRYLPDLFHKNKMRQNFGERTAMNTPIQGTAADIIKVAMIRLHQVLAQEGFQARMLLQVHDELIFEVPKEEMERLAPRVKEVMEGAVELSVPLVVDLKAGPNWYDMTPVLV